LDISLKSFLGGRDVSDQLLARVFPKKTFLHTDLPKNEKQPQPSGPLALKSFQQPPNPALAHPIHH
jgi:hypothetical protein